MDVSVIKNNIFEVRGQRVMLDYHLAALYQVETRALKQAVRRNMERFPEDFMFQLTPDEFKILQLDLDDMDPEEPKTGRHSKYLPFVFSELGVGMLSSVLRSATAIEINISIMRAFVLMRQLALGLSELHDRVERIEQEMGMKFQDVFQILQHLLGGNGGRTIVEGFKPKKGLTKQHPVPIP